MKYVPGPLTKIEVGKKRKREISTGTGTKRRIETVNKDNHEEQNGERDKKKDKISG